MIRLFLVLLTFALPAHATQDQWPALFDVTGVASNDVLNLRAQPSAEAPVVGSLRFDAKGVEVIEPNDRHTWGRVNTGEGSGWVSLRYLKRQPGQWFGAGLRPATCFGTEPFWSLAIDDDALTWSSPEDSGTDGQVLDRMPGQNRFDREAMSVRFEDGRDGVAVMRLESCGDGMSDREYGISVDMILGRTDGAGFYSGCCSLSR